MPLNLDCFAQNTPPELVDELESVSDLESRLAALEARGKNAWPDLQLPAGHFPSALAGRLTTSPPKKGLEQWLDHVQAEDFYLALACGAGIPGAIEAFETLFQKDLARMIARYEGPTMPAEDLGQQLREKLFVDTPKRRARIHSYSGQGHFQNWLRVTGTRIFIDLLRGTAKRRERELQVADDHFLDVPDDVDDVELSFLKREYRAQFKAAFAKAAAGLTSHERNLLRQHLVFRLTVEQIGELYSVHASTASRRIAKAREALLNATRESLMDELKIDQSEFDSIMFMIRSRLDLSMPRVLQTAIHEPA